MFPLLQDHFLILLNFLNAHPSLPSKFLTLLIIPFLDLPQECRLSFPKFQILILQNPNFLTSPFQLEHHLVNFIILQLNSLPEHLSLILQTLNLLSPVPIPPRARRHTPSPRLPLPRLLSLPSLPSLLPPLPFLFPLPLLFSFLFFFPLFFPLFLFLVLFLDLETELGL